MGLNVSQINVKINPKEYINGMSFPQDINPFYADRNKIGDVFVVVFKHPYLDRKFAHHAVIIDIAGSSTDSHLCGATIHLTAVASTKITKFQIYDRSYLRKIFYEIIHVGRVQPWQSSPWEWAFDLQREGLQLFRRWTNEGANVIWSSQINCQTFVNFWLKEHGFDWPDQLPYFSEDHTPAIVDLSIDLIHLSTKTSVKFTGNHDEE